MPWSISRLFVHACSHNSGHTQVMDTPRRHVSMSTSFSWDLKHFSPQLYAVVRKMIINAPKMIQNLQLHPFNIVKLPRKQVRSCYHAHYSSFKSSLAQQPLQIPRLTLTEIGENSSIPKAYKSADTGDSFLKILHERPLTEKFTDWCRMSTIRT